MSEVNCNAIEKTWLTVSGPGEWLTGIRRPLKKVSGTLRRHAFAVFQSHVQSIRHLFHHAFEFANHYSV